MPDAASRVGQILGRYEIVEKLGEGGMGVVYQAFDAQLRRFVALKLLPAGKADDPGRRRRLLREARVASALQHPGIVTVHELFSHQGADVLVMEHVAGEPLRRRIPAAGLNWKTAATYAAAIADALAAAHSTGVLHRDLKPENVMITAEGRVKVLDFGIARLSPPAEEPKEAETLSSSFGDETLERAGTLAYMSPEQTLGEDVDPRSDIFSLGVVLYEMSSGRHPFPGSDVVAFLHELHFGRPRPLRELCPKIPEALDALVGRCLARKRQERPTSMEEVLAELRRILAPVAGDKGPMWLPAVGREMPHRPNWRLVERLGRGGFGEVWLARHKSGEARVFKICLDRERARALRREVTLFRLMKEALGHRDDIARILDWSLEEAPYLLEVEHAESGNLAQWAAAQGGLDQVPEAQRLELVAEVAEALDAAHSVGILHQDVKPENVLVRLDRDGRPHAVLTDFGVAHLKAKEKLEAAPFTVLGFTASTLLTGAGTLGYVAPELIEGKPASVRSDIYSLGVMLYQMAVGDLSRALAPGWRREIEDDVLCDDLAWFVDGRPERRPESALAVAQRLRTLDERRVLRAEAESAKAALQRSQHLRRTTVLFGAVAVVVALVVGAFAVRAERARRKARDLARAVIAGNLLAEGQATWGNLAALEVRHPEETPSAVATLRKSLADPVELLSPVPMTPSPDSATPAVFSDDGARIAVVDGHKVRILEVRSGEEIISLEHDGTLQAAVFSPNGSRVVTFGRDDWIWVWDVATGRNTLTLRGQAGLVRRAAWSPDGSRIVTASQGGTASIWDAASGGEISRLLGHTGPIWDVAWSPDGSRVATSSKDRTARIWDAATGTEIALLDGHGDSVKDVDWSPDGSRVLTAAGRWFFYSLDATARVWDAATGELLLTLEHAEGLSAARFSPDGSRIVTASRDRTAAIWDAATGQRLFTLWRHTDQVLDASWSPDGAYVLTASGDKTARIWNAFTGQPVAVLTGHEGRVDDARWSTDGSRIVTDSADGTARIWSPQVGQEIAVLRGHADSLRQLSESPDGSRIATAACDGTARIWNAATGEPSAVLDVREVVPEGEDDWVFDVAWSGDGSRLVTTSSDNTAQIWDVATGEETARLVGHTHVILRASWSRDGSRILTASLDGTARVWDLATGAQAMVLSGPRKGVWQAAWNADESRIMTLSADGAARIWDAASGAELFCLREPGLSSAAWSGDGSRIATNSGDGHMRTWDARTGETLAVLSGHEKTVHHLAWNGDGPRILSASADGTARVWDAATGEELLRLQGHTAEVLDASWNADGSKIATASVDGTARLWDAATGQVIAVFEGHAQFVPGVRFSHDGSKVFTWSGSEAHVWAVPEDPVPYLQGLVRARTPLCLSSDVLRERLGETKADAERRHVACEACVPVFFERLDRATRADSRTYVEAWKVYERCLADPP